VLVTARRKEVHADDDLLAGLGRVRDQRLEIGLIRQEEAPVVPGRNRPSSLPAQ
jgi:hypothetical protein